MIAYIRIIFMFFFFVGCILESEETGEQKATPRTNSAPTTTYVNPDLQKFSPELYFYQPSEAPSARIISPESFKSNSYFVDIELSRLNVGDYLYLYNDPSCLSSLILAGREVELSQEVISQELTGGDGDYIFFARTESRDSGSFSPCYELNISYHLDTTPPAVPKIQLHSPRAVREKVLDIELVIKDYESNSSYQIFTDVNCKNKVGSGVLSGAEQLLPISLDVDANYIFYAILEDDVGNKTYCLKTSAFYELDTTPPLQALVTKLKPIDEIISKGSSYNIEGDYVGDNSVTVNIKFEELELNGKLQIFENFNTESIICNAFVDEIQIDQSEIEVSIGLEKGDGKYRYSYILLDDLGNKSECLDSGVFYELDRIAPAPPLASSTEILEDPIGNFLFLVKSIPVEHSGSLFLFIDSTCTEQIDGYPYDEDLGFFNAGISSLPTGTVEIYGKYMDVAGNISECSQKLGDYELSLMVSGALTYDFVPVGKSGVLHGNTEARPMRGIVVDLVDMNPSSPQYRSTVSSTVTNDFGNYTFFLNKERVAKIIVRAELANPPTFVQNPDASLARYSAVSEVFLADNIHTINLHAASGWVEDEYAEERSAAPFAILDSIYSAYKKINDLRPNLSWNTLTVNWGTENNEGAYFVPSLNELYLKGKAGVETDEYDRHLVVHEWGHFFEQNLSRSDSMGGSHGVGDTKDISLAFGEGFATSLAAMVFEPDALYIDTFFWSDLNVESGFVMDVEHDNFRPDSNPGWFSELSVQQTLYDIVDVGTEEYDEPHDNLALGMGPILDIMTGPQVNTPARTSIFTFITYLKEMFPNLISEIDQLIDLKGINTITDIWGSASDIYSDLYPDFPFETFTVYGGYLHNDASSNKHIRYMATSTKTKFTFIGSSYYLVDIFHNGNNKYNSGIYFNVPNEVYEVEVNTVIGEYYSIKLTTSKEAVSGGAVNIQVRGENI